MKNNIKGFSLIIALGLVILITLLVMLLLEYIIPYSRDVKGIENSANAYYLANSGIEEGLYKVYERNNSGSITNTDEFSEGLDGTRSDSSFKTYSSGSILPPPGEGNSTDPNFNTISIGDPIQLDIGNNMIDFSSNDFKVLFRMPDSFASYTLSGAGNSPPLDYVKWQLSSDNDSINSTGSYIIDAGNVNVGSNLVIDTYVGESINGLSSPVISSFYSSNCGVNSGCTLKFSVIDELKTTSGLSLPHLEWKIDVGTSRIPLRYTDIESEGKFIGYKKKLGVKVKSNTVNEAFDFTIFQ